MSLVAGTRLGPYEIQSAIGAGGMGEVYKARDTRLDRVVAIKVLPSELSADTDRRVRFEREARAIAALNHPHICTLHDIGTHPSTGSGQATLFLVMEYLAGESLADRLLRGPVPLAQALDIAAQIADALDAAHKHGIIHRDLKPGNVMLTGSGAGRSGVTTAKLLDFGLAKLARHGERPPIESQTHMPTQAAPVTAQGTILGTLQYMAPEQLEGKEADARTDLWALGAILYEMLTGRRAFEGESQASLIAAIMSLPPPPVSAVQPITPSALERVVDRCLAKDPDARWQNASDLAAELAWLAGDSARPAVAAPGGAPMRAARRWPLAAVVLAVALALGAGAALWRWWNPPNVRPLRVAIPVSSWNLALDTTPGGLALSPDGQTVVFSANRPGEPSQLWVRRANDMEPRPLAGTQFARLPFFSPDGQHVAFATSYGAVVRVPLAGGSPQQIWAPAPEFEGGAWGTDGTIVFAGGYVRPGLFYVSAEGGAASKALYEAPADGRGGRYAFPEILPDGQTILFTIRSTRGARVHAWSPERGVKPITEGARARYVSTGHLLYEDGETLRLVGFDATRLEVVGTPRVVAQNVMTGAEHAMWAVAGSQTLVYAPSYAGVERIVWKDRRGATIPLPLRQRAYAPYPALSRRDGQLVIPARMDGTVTRLMIGETGREPLQPLGGDDLVETFFPSFTADGRWVVVTCRDDKGRYNIFRVPADGSGRPERLTEGAEPMGTPAVSPDGKTLLVTVIGSQGGHVWQKPFDPLGPLQAFIFTPGAVFEGFARFSRDGRWIAYMVQDKSGAKEVWVTSRQPHGARQQVSTNGGQAPVWNPAADELFYQGPRTLMSVKFVNGRPLAPVEMFPMESSAANASMYDVAPDGDKFLVVERDRSDLQPSQLYMLLDWLEGLTSARK